MLAPAPQHAPHRRTAARAAVVGVLATLLLFFPGGMSSDSIAQLAQARSGLYTTWHPPVMAWLWHVVEAVLPGPFGMMLLQALAWWGGLALLARRAFPGGHEVSAAQAEAGWRMALFVGFWPPIFGMVGTVWKDVQLAAALTLATGLVVAARGPRRRSMLVGALVAIAYGTAMRHNGAFAGLPLAVWAGWALLDGLKGRTARVAATGAIALATLGAPIVANHALARFDNHLDQILYVFDLAGTSVQAHTVLVPAAIQVRPLTLGALAAAYDPNYVDSLYPTTLALTDDPAVVSELREAWKRAIVEHPTAYLAHRAAFYQRMLGLSPLVWFAYHQGIEPNDLGVAYPTSWLTKGVCAIFWVLKFTPAYRPVFYLMGLVAALWAGAAAWRRRRPFAVPAVVIAASGLLYAAPNPVLGIAADLRYHLWSLVAAMLAWALLMAGRRDEAPRATAAPEAELQPIAG